MLIVQDPDNFYQFFSYLVNNFLNLLLCHEFVLSLRPIFFFAVCFFLQNIISSLLCLMCELYPLLIISCSNSLEWYASSRHRFCLYLDLLCDDDGHLITILSIVFVAATVTSWVFAAYVIKVDKGIPFLSVRILDDLLYSLIYQKVK